jgi:NADP-dependent 3-hydroxy acid dehydrogenase YdfG
MQQFQTNVFGVLNVTNAVLPHMRERRSGTIVIIGSRTGWHAAVPVCDSLYFAIEVDR